MVKRWQYPSLAEPVSQALGPVEVITLDKWLAYPPEPVRKRRHSQAVYTKADSFVNISIAPAVPLLSTWYQPASEPVRRKPHARYFTKESFVNTSIAPAVPLLVTWYQPLSEPVRRKPPGKYFTDLELVLDEAQRPEVITLDKWFQELSTPVIPRFKPYYYPSSGFRTELAIVPVVITKQLKVSSVSLIDADKVGTVIFIGQYKVGEIEFVC